VPSGQTEWKPPSDDHLPDLSVLGGFVDYGIPDYSIENAKVVPVRFVVGLSFPGLDWHPDWTLRTEAFEDKALLAYHQEKLSHLLDGWPERGLPPMTQEWLLSDKGCRLLDLVELDGVYFVGSGGVHRIAAAHQRGFRSVRAPVVVCTLKQTAPTSMVAWIQGLRDAADR